MKTIFNKLTGLNTAAWFCWALAMGAVGLAFPGAMRAGALMVQPYMLLSVALLALLFLFVGVRSVSRRRFDSTLLHLGCSLVLVGWLWGRYAERYPRPEHPANGSMVLVDGEESDQLWRGAKLDEFVGRAPFAIRLERFIVERYQRSGDDRDAGRDAPIKEYRSRITIKEPDREPYTANVRVNYPVYVRGYHIYQMSWGVSSDRLGRPLTYTVLQFIRDPGVPLVYAGFMMVVVGVLLFMFRVLRAGEVGAKRETINGGGAA